MNMIRAVHRGANPGKLWDNYLTEVTQVDAGGRFAQSGGGSLSVQDRWGSPATVQVGDYVLIDRPDYPRPALGILAGVGEGGGSVYRLGEDGQAVIEQVASDLIREADRSQFFSGEYKNDYFRLNSALVGKLGESRVRTLTARSLREADDAETNITDLDDMNPQIEPDGGPDDNLNAMESRMRHKESALTTHWQVRMQEDDDALMGDDNDEVPDDDGGTDTVNIHVDTDSHVDEEVERMVDRWLAEEKKGFEKMGGDTQDGQGDDEDGDDEDGDDEDGDEEGDDGDADAQALAALNQQQNGQMPVQNGQQGQMPPPQNGQMPMQNGQQMGGVQPEKHTHVHLHSEAVNRRFRQLSRQFLEDDNLATDQPEQVASAAMGADDFDDVEHPADYVSAMGGDPAGSKMDEPEDYLDGEEGTETSPGATMDGLLGESFPNADRMIDAYLAALREGEADVGDEIVDPTTDAPSPADQGDEANDPKAKEQDPADLGDEIVDPHENQGDPDDASEPFGDSRMDTMPESIEEDICWEAVEAVMAKTLEEWDGSSPVGWAKSGSRKIGMRQKAYQKMKSDPAKYKAYLAKKAEYRKKHKTTEAVVEEGPRFMKAILLNEAVSVNGKDGSDNDDQKAGPATDQGVDNDQGDIKAEAFRRNLNRRLANLGEDGVGIEAEDDPATDENDGMGLEGGDSQKAESRDFR